MGKKNSSRKNVCIKSSSRHVVLTLAISSRHVVLTLAISSSHVVLTLAISSSHVVLTLAMYTDGSVDVCSGMFVLPNIIYLLCHIVNNITFGCTYEMGAQYT